MELSSFNSHSSSLSHGCEIISSEDTFIHILQDYRLLAKQGVHTLFWCHSFHSGGFGSLFSFAPCFSPLYPPHLCPSVSESPCTRVSIGFDLSEKSGRDHAPLSVRPHRCSLLPRTFHMHFHSDLSQNKGKWFLPRPFVLERGDKLQMCSRAFVLEMAFSYVERKLMKSVEHIKVV